MSAVASIIHDRVPFPAGLDTMMAYEAIFLRRYCPDQVMGIA
jgi:hypothetical protein